MIRGEDSPSPGSGVGSGRGSGSGVAFRLRPADYAVTSRLRRDESGRVGAVLPITYHLSPITVSEAGTGTETGTRARI